MKARLAVTLQALLGLVLAWPGVAAAVQTMRQAEVCVHLEGQAAGCSWQPWNLPYLWDGQHPGRAGLMQARLRFALPPGHGAEQQALWLPRAGNGLRVLLNGQEVGGSLRWDEPNGPDGAKAPHLLLLPAALLQTNNELLLELRADRARRAGLAVPQVGPLSQLHPLQRRAYLQRVVASEVGTALCGVVALLGLALWASQRRGPQAAAAEGERPPPYLMAALSMGSWSLFFADPVIEVPWPPWPLWGLLQASAFALAISAITLFCQGLVGLDSPRWRRHVWWVAAAGAAAAAATLGWGLWQAWSAWLLAVVVGYAFYGLYYAVQCLRRPEPLRLFMAAVVLINVFGGAVDFIFVLRSGDLYGDNLMGRFLPLLYGLALGTIMVLRFRQAAAQADRLTASMAEQVRAKSAELETSYAQMAQLAHEQTRAAERSRILRDMHDGVGSHIASAIRQLQSGRSENGQVLLTLRESMDHLKLSIDSMNLPPGDVAALLADLRYRLEPRLRASDLGLVWQVEPIAPLLRLDTDALRQLQYVLYEALSNVMQHAHASELRVSAREEGDAVVVEVADNGCGFDAEAPATRGLASMRKRCEALGATLQLHSRVGQGSRVSLRLPRQ